MTELLNILRQIPLWQASALLLVENLVVFTLAIVIGHLMMRMFNHRRVTPQPARISRTEIALTVSTVILNTLITVIGLLLWRAGVISFRDDVGLWSLLDVLMIVLVMDLAMYALHRLAHHRRLFPLLHRTHHNYNNPRPLTLFVLNPAEAVSFGSLWLVLVSCYSFSWLGISVYLTLNVIFGTIGHLGVEPLPDSWQQSRALKYLSTSTFHARHHNDGEHNFGFYTTLWDRLFGTLQTSGRGHEL